MHLNFLQSIKQRKTRQTTSVDVFGDWKRHFFRDSTEGLPKVLIYAHFDGSKGTSREGKPAICKNFLIYSEQWCK